MSTNFSDRHFFRSFPRPKAGELAASTLNRGLAILAFMKESGLVLAPEIVEWDVKTISPAFPPLRILQQRACFTELSTSELPTHSAIFGPISLQIDLAKLRNAGATPVIYVPQGTASSVHSLIGTFCANGIFHTKHVLSQLNALKEIGDPSLAEKKFGMPLMPNATIDMQIRDPATGVIIETFPIQTSDALKVIKYINYNAIPFDHSIGLLNVCLNMFYPTDNAHTGDALARAKLEFFRAN